eukprot:scaffold3310_cov283-Chaetoceros_neogracile.AAC.27
MQEVGQMAGGDSTLRKYDEVFSRLRKYDEKGHNQSPVVGKLGQRSYGAKIAIPEKLGCINFLKCRVAFGSF